MKSKNPPSPSNTNTTSFQLRNKCSLHQVVGCWLASSVNKMFPIGNLLSDFPVRLVFLLALSLFIGALLMIAVFRCTFRPISALTLPYIMNRAVINALGLLAGWLARFEEQRLAKAGKPVRESDYANTFTSSAN